MVRGDAGSRCSNRRPGFQLVIIINNVFEEEKPSVRGSWRVDVSVSSVLWREFVTGFQL